MPASELQGSQFGLVAALALLGKGLQGLSLARIGLLAMALFKDVDVELELLLALLLPALEPAAEISSPDFSPRGLSAVISGPR